MTKMHFKNEEVKYSKRCGLVTDDFISLFWPLKKFQVEHCFPANVQRSVMEHRLSTAIGLVSRLFRSCSLKF